jgi:hypothetical protein
MKMMLAHIYWLSLRDVLEPIFDWYFAWTAPEKLAAQFLKAVACGASCENFGKRSVFIRPTAIYTTKQTVGWRERVN